MKNFINVNVTIPKGYVVVDSGTYGVQSSNLKEILKLAKKLEKNNILMSTELTMALATLDEVSFEKVLNDIKASTKAQKGQFLKSCFASGADLDDEQMTLDDLYLQFYEYFNSYGLGRVPVELFGEDVTRRIQTANIVKRDDKQDLNNTFRIIDVKTSAEFVNDVAIILTSPIVFGSQQVEFIKEAFENNLLEEISDIQIKVKENLFQFISIIGKEKAKELDIFKTATDILRYCYFVSGEDYKELPQGVKFNLKTSDKKVVMAALNKLDSVSAFGDMKPNSSQWLAVSKNLFPGSSKFDRWTKAQGLFDFIRNNGKVETFNTITQKLISKKLFSTLAIHLSKRPGELLRSLDMIIRNSTKSEINDLIDVINNIKLNPKLVIQVRKWLAYRTENAMTERTFKVKGKPKTISTKPLDALKTKRTMKVVQALRGIMIRHLEGKTLFEDQLKELDAYEAMRLQEERDVAI